MATNKLIGTLLFRIASDTKSLRKGMAQTQSSVGRLKKSVMGLGAAFGAAFGAHTVIRAIQNVARTFMDFEQSMANVKAISRATQPEFERLSKLARDLGGTTAWTASQVAQLETEYAKLGFTTLEIEKAAEATLNLAIAAGTELARAAEVVGGVIRAFGKDASEATNVTDIMAHAFSSTALDMEKFAEAMKYVGPVAASANISLEESTALVSILANNMIDGSMAGTGLRMIINQLAKSGKPLAERLKDLAAKGLSLAEAEGEVGKRAQTAFLVLLKNAGLLPSLTAEYDNVTGATKRMADIMLDTVRGELKLFNSALDELKITFGVLTEESGIFRESIEKLTTGIQKLAGFLNSDLYKSIQYIRRAMFDLLIPTERLFGYWDKIFGKKAKWTGSAGGMASRYGGTGQGFRRDKTGGAGSAGSAGGAGGGFAKASSLASIGTANWVGLGGDMAGILNQFPKGAEQYKASIERIAESNKILKTSFQETGPHVIDWVKNMSDETKQAAKELELVNAVIAESFQNLFVSIGEGLGSTLTGGMENVFNNILTTVADFAVKFGALLIAMGIGRGTLDKLALTGAPAVIAGIALVALGSAMKGLLAKGPMGGGVTSGGGSADGGLASIPITGTTKIQGRDIVIAYERGSSYKNATT